MTAKTYDRQTGKFIARVTENMPEMSDEVMQGWIENPMALQKALKKALCPPETTSEFKTWKTVKLGTGPKTADDFRKSLKDNGFSVGDWANDILGNPAFSVATEETEIDLVVVSVAELGFKDGDKREDIYARAKELGLDLCLAEVGPQLRLQYKDQPNGEWLIVAMEPITDSDGLLRLFDVKRDAYDLWLDSSCDDPAYFWDGLSRFVFVLPRK